MLATKQCLDCLQVRPVEAFQKTKNGTGRADRCGDCIDQRTAAYRIEEKRSLEELDAELAALPPNQPVPEHLLDTLARWVRTSPGKRQTRARSNRPHMAQCHGCGETIPKLDLYEYRVRGSGLGRSRYCRACNRLRSIERECRDCGETRLADEFFAGLLNPSPYCAACREKRTREKRCPQCKTIKPLDAFSKSLGRPSGRCKECMKTYQRERRARARLQKGVKTHPVGE